MYKKIRSIVFTIGIILVLVTCTYIIYTKENNKTLPDFGFNDNSGDNSDSNDSSDSSGNDKTEVNYASYEGLHPDITADTMKELDEESRNIMLPLIDELKEYKDRAMEAKANPGYDLLENDTYSINPDFIVNETSYRNICGLVEYEYIDCEIIEDISEYMEGINWEDTSKEYVLEVCTKKGFSPDIYEFLEKKYVNTDGTLNVIKDKRWIYDKDYNLNRVECEAELAAIKIKVRYKNLSVFENKVNYRALHNVTFIDFFDDRKLYMPRFFDEVFNTREALYTSLGDRKWFSDETLMLYEFILQPLEEVEGEFIYLLHKEELDYLYFEANWTDFFANGDATNYKDIGTKYVSFKYLLDKFKDGEE